MELALKYKTAPEEQLRKVPRILAVDDDRVILMILEERLKHKHYEVECVRSGVDAMDLLKRTPDHYDVVVLDREMPVMTGLEMVRQMKAHPLLKEIPVVMQTGSGRPEQIKEGIEAGVFYYLTKPVEENLLYAVVEAALRETEQRRVLRQLVGRHQGCFQKMQTAKFLINTLDEAEDLSGFLANCYPDPSRTLIGLAELIVNAVEHGAYKIGYEEKSMLLSRGAWRQEMARRAEMPEYKERQVEVLMQRKPEGIYVQISDPGEGFDWKRYLTIDPARASHAHGRGIARANIQSFDKLQYLEKGNRVIAVVYLGKLQKSPLEW